MVVRMLSGNGIYFTSNIDLHDVNTTSTFYRMFCDRLNITSSKTAYPFPGQFRSRRTDGDRKRVVRDGRLPGEVSSVCFLDCPPFFAYDPRLPAVVHGGSCTLADMVPFNRNQGLGTVLIYHVRSLTVYVLPLGFT